MDVNISGQPKQLEREDYKYLLVAKKVKKKERKQTLREHCSLLKSNKHYSGNSIMV